MTWLRRYWGYAAAVILIALWANSAGPGLLLLLSAAVTFYFLFQVPVWCCAVNRDGTLCRRNSSGVLLGCALRQHKWQRLRLAVVPHARRQFNEGLGATPGTRIASVSAPRGIVSALAAVVALILR